LRVWRNPDARDIIDISSVINYMLSKFREYIAVFIMAEGNSGIGTGTWRTHGSAG
jgi:hypothetical protein